VGRKIAKRAREGARGACLQLEDCQQEGGKAGEHVIRVAVKLKLKARQFVKGNGWGRWGD